MISPPQFGAALETVYRQAPCQVLPNALWKTRAQLDDCETRVWSDRGRITGLLMRSPDMLHVYWQRARDEALGLPLDWKPFNLALLHQDFIDVVPSGHFTRQTAYFRLMHRGTPISPHYSEGFYVKDVRLETEAAEVAAFIDRNDSIAAVGLRVRMSGGSFPGDDPVSICFIFTV